ncbi:histone acetyltransferase KAT7 isoform X5, partial [Brachionus plicatilis]
HICKEQSLHLQKINKELKSLVKLPESNKLNKQSKLNFLKNADFVSDLKNLSTSFIINSLSNCLYTSPTPVSHYALLKHTSSESLNFFTSLNQTIAQTPDLNDLKISQYELDLFKDVLVSSTKEPIPAASNAKKIKLINKSDKIIQFGNHEIETWYKSPYPDDYWQLNKIFICQYCLTFMKSHSVLNRHLEKCLWRHPPGREIYRKDNLSFFEVDGKINKIYCQNLCLLAKLFIDHKTLYYEVEPFLFYVLTRYNEENGSFQMIGYFSKEKQSVLNYNLSCILILPQYMNQGYGRVLIDFSYLLSRAEGKVGSPERPLSDLGLISYRSYWKSKLLLYLSKHLDDAEISVKEITAETGILTNDLISTLQYIGLIKYWKGKHVILKDVDYIQRYVEKKNLYSRDMDEVCLKWSPYVYQPIISETGVPGKNLVKNNKTCLPSN